MVREMDGETQIGADGADVSVLLEAFTIRPRPPDHAWPDTDGRGSTSRACGYRPTGNFTITDNFPTNSNGELTLAQGDSPLLQPTEIGVPGSVGVRRPWRAQNAARRIILDDGSTTLFLLAPNQATTTPAYISNDHPYRTGASGLFTDDVIFSEGASGYRFEPLSRSSAPTISTRRTPPSTPARHPTPAHRGRRHAADQGRVVQRAELLHHAG